MNPLERCNRMSALWDEAADALKVRDYAEFDRIMHAFRDINRQPREPAAANNRPGRH